MKENCCHHRESPRGAYVAGWSGLISRKRTLKLILERWREASHSECGVWQEASQVAALQSVLTLCTFRTGLQQPQLLFTAALVCRRPERPKPALPAAFESQVQKLSRGREGALPNQLTLLPLWSQFSSKYPLPAKWSLKCQHANNSWTQKKRKTALTMQMSGRINTLVWLCKIISSFAELIWSESCKTQGSSRQEESPRVVWGNAAPGSMAPASPFCPGSGQ